MFYKTILKVFGLCIIGVGLLTTLQCARKTVSGGDLPKDISGISVGMDKAAAEKHLKEISKLLREENREQVWILRDGARFGHLAVAYNRENRVQFVTAIARPNGETKMKPEEVGSLDAAKQETNGPNYSYQWEVPAAENAPAYVITAQGSQPESLSLYTMSAAREENLKEDEEERREKRETIQPEQEKTEKETGKK